MRSVRVLTGSLCLALAWTQTRPADAQMMRSGPSMLTSAPMMQVQAPAGPQAPTTPQAPARPAAPQDQAAQAPQANLFGEAAPSGTEAPGGAYAPQMLGDSVVYFTNGLPLNHNQLVQALTNPGGLGVGLVTALGLPAGTIFSGSSGQRLFGDVTATALAGLAGSAFKIADNESARPETRAYLNFDYITGINQTSRAFDPADFGNTRVARAIFGYEHTFLDGDASIEVRVPMFGFRVGESINAGPIDFSDVGDITLVTKFALINDRDTGNVLTVGLALTLPTGPDQTTLGFVFNPTAGTLSLAPNNVINPTILQPYVGYVYNISRDLYVQGFSSLAIPFQDTVPTVWFNDIGVGYFAYRGSDCSIVPTAELHMTTAFNHDSIDSFPVGAPDELITTLGIHLVWRDADLTFGYDFPLTGPQPFGSEWIAQLNWHF